VAQGVATQEAITRGDNSPAINVGNGDVRVTYFGVDAGTLRKLLAGVLALLLIGAMILAVVSFTRQKLEQVVPEIAGQVAEVNLAGEARHTEQMAAILTLRDQVARDRGVDPEVLRPLFEHLGQLALSPSEMRARAQEAITAILSRAQQPPPTTLGADIAAVIVEARRRLGRLDTAGALAGLTAKLAEEEAARRQRLFPLMREKAAIERLTYAHAAAKATLGQVLALAPDDVRAAIELGDLHVTTGDLTAALRSYRDALAIAERLASADPGNAGWQHDLSVSHNKTGDVQVAQGDLAAALRSYRASHDIFERLASADPGNAAWQRALSVSHGKIGDVQRAQGDLTAALRSYRASHDIFERLASADPGNAAWQRDLSVSHSKIGDVQVAQGDLVAALRSYRVSHDIFERLASADPGNAGWQRDLSVSLERIGDVQRAQGDLAAALRNSRASHDIFERLASADPGNAVWQRDLMLSCVKLSEAAPQEAQAWLTRALGIARDLAANGRLAPVDAGMPADLERRLAELGG